MNAIGATALLLPAAWHAGSAVAGDARWLGWGDAPYWDDSANWLSRPPVSGTTRVLLDGFDTILRQGNFLAHSVQGTGALEVRGGHLKLVGGPSALGHLDLQGGRLTTAGALTMQSLRWSGGAGDGDEPWTVLGRAVFTTSRDVGRYGLRSLRLMGDSFWEASATSLYSGDVLIGGSGRFVDRAGTAGHYLSGRLIVEGQYVKTGTKTTHHFVHYFENKGRLLVQQGGVSTMVPAGSDWVNSGRLRLDPGTAYSIDFDRYTGFTQSGTIDIGRGARFEISSAESSLYSPGTWRVAEGGTLTFGAFSMYQPSRTRSSFTGAIENDGTVVLRSTEYRFTGGGEIRGKGWVNVIEGATLNMNNGRAASLGGLRIEGEGSYDKDQSNVRVNGALTLNGLEWGAGTLTASGNVTIKGRAVLHHGAYRSPHQDSTTGEFSGDRVYDKHLSSDFHFRGGAVWGGDADLVGSGQIHVAAGTTFEERDLPQSVPERAGRLTQVGVTAFHNSGTYVKTRSGTTVVQSSFYNTGGVRLSGAGPLRFEGPLNNIGALEVANGRLEVRGPLAQWASRRQEQGSWGSEPVLVQTLTGGRYVMQNGTLALRLGNPDGAAAGQILESQASIVLAGPAARLVNTWSGVDENALIGLRYNGGELRVLEGASLEIGRSLRNQGTLEVGAGSELHLRNSAYVQAEEAASTWIGGFLRSTRFDLVDGRFGAGSDGEVGQAVSAAGVVPEPESTVLMVLGLCGLVGWMARRRQPLRNPASRAASGSC